MASVAPLSSSGLRQGEEKPRSSGHSESAILIKEATWRLKAAFSLSLLRVARLLEDRMLAVSLLGLHCHGRRGTWRP